MSLKELLKTLKSDKLLLPKIEHHLISQQTSGIGDGWIHPSGITDCLRAQVMNCLHYPYVKNISARVQRIFDNGTSMHERFQSYFKAMGILLPCYHCQGTGCKSCRGTGVEHPFAWADRRTRGTCDGIIPVGKLSNIEPYVLELKSMKDSLFQALGGPSHANYWQGHLYMMGHNIKQMIFIYENKNDQNLKEFIVRWDEEMWQQVDNKITLINKHVDAAERELPDSPLRAKTLPMGDCKPEELDTDCQFCAACGQCFKEGK